MRRIREAITRKEMIDPALETAGWHLRDKSRVGLEIPVDGYDAQPWNGMTDYCLYRPNGEVIAVVEAKRTTTDPRLAQAQAAYYVTEIAKKQSFIFKGGLRTCKEITPQAALGGCIEWRFNVRQNTALVCPSTHPTLQGLRSPPFSVFKNGGRGVWLCP